MKSVADSRENQPDFVKQWKAVALFGCENVLFFWQLRHPIIRFERPIANELIGLILGLCLPWFTAAAIFRFGRWWSKAISFVAVIPLLLYSAMFLLASAMTGGVAFDRFAETHWKGSEIRFYRTNGGATTDFGVVIRQERSLFPGVLLVRRLDDFYPCYSLHVASTIMGIAVSDERSECDGFQEHRREYRLKPFLYF